MAYTKVNWTENTPISANNLATMDIGIYQSMPRGGIIMWYGSIAGKFDSTGLGIGELEGWALCNGNNGTPDLRDRFVVCIGNTYSMGNTGGANSVTLNVSQIPAHSHSISNDGDHIHTMQQSGEHQHTLDMKNVGRFGGGEGTWGTGQTYFTSVSGLHIHNINASGLHSHGGITGNTGSNQPHENRPPYYALAFIMRI